MKPISPELIEKYLRGECTLEEKAIVLKWYNSFDAKMDHYETLTDLQKQELSTLMFDNIESGIHPNQEIKNNSVKYLKRVVYFIGAAAAIILVIYLPGLLKPQRSTQATASVQDEEIVITNRSQAIAKQILPDNSIVWLSPDAQIKYHKIFKKELREVTLSGESFFEVTKDKAHPFVVYSRNITTRVWGTSFRIRDFKNSSHAEVAVVTGKVSVTIARDNQRKGLFKSNAGLRDNVMLLPNQNVVYEKAQNSLQIGKVNAASSISIWQKASLSFDNVPLKDVISALNKQFNVEIILQDKELGDYLLQADFSDQSLPDVMEMLKKLLRLTYVTDGKKFMLQKGYSN